MEMNHISLKVELKRMPKIRFNKYFIKRIAEELVKIRFIKSPPSTKDLQRINREVKRALSLHKPERLLFELFTSRNRNLINLCRF